jgi:hypothetical protein
MRVLAILISLSLLFNVSIGSLPDQSVFDFILSKVNVENMFGLMEYENFYFCF